MVSNARFGTTRMFRNVYARLIRSTDKLGISYWNRYLSSDVAEGVGFEPTRDLATPGGFQDRCLKPLGHPSNYLSWLNFWFWPPGNFGVLLLKCYPTFPALLLAMAKASSRFSTAVVSIPSIRWE